MTRLKLDDRRILGELRTRRAQLSGSVPIATAPDALDFVRDPVLAQLMTQLNAYSAVIAYNQQNATPAASARHVQRPALQSQALQQQIDARVGILRDEALRKRRAEIEAEAVQLDTQHEIVMDQENKLADDLERMRGLVEQIGTSSTDVEMMRAEINQHESVLHSIAEERERLKVELRSGGRAIVLQRADVPEGPDTSVRFRLAALTGLLGFALPLGLIVGWDVRTRRISSTEDLSGPLGLEVLGAVPVVPGRAVHPFHPLPPRRRKWRAGLHQAVNGIAARVICEGNERGSRVLLISSASSGEGKTTLASQLALALGREGYRTLLLDFDLRKAAIHKVFDLPVGPGVSELAAGQCSLEEVEHAVAANLRVVTAGTGGPLSLRMFTCEGMSKLFARSREEYEFVIVDASPVLPVADARLVSRHADAVILSVLRDVSRSPRVLAAARALEAFGVSRIGTVMISSSCEVY
jgi:polysaccharide biosynthesis transport protein